MDVRARRQLALVLAAACAATDLAVKAALGTEIRHQRNGLVVLASFALAAALLALVPRLPSQAAAIAAGFGVGGAAGNGLSALLWSGGVPDPLRVTHGGSYLAFNLADVFAIGAAPALVAAAAVYALRHAGSLRAPL